MGSDNNPLIHIIDGIQTVIKKLERSSYDPFRRRPWNQDSPVDEKRSPVEFLLAGDVGNRLVFPPPLDPLHER